MWVDKRAIHKENWRSPRDSGFGIGDSKNSAVIPGPTQGAGHGAAPAFPNPQSRIPNPVKSICVYCGSNAGLRPAYAAQARSEEHTSELQSPMRISYAVFCLKKTNPQPST